MSDKIEPMEKTEEVTEFEVRVVDLGAKEPVQKISIGADGIGLADLLDKAGVKAKGRDVTVAGIPVAEKDIAGTRVAADSLVVVSGEVENG